MMEMNELQEFGIEGKAENLKAAYDFLYSVRNAERRVKNIEKRIMIHEDAADEPGEDVQMETLRHELMEAEHEETVIRKDVCDTVCMLSDVNEQAILMYRYIDGMSWEHIGDVMKMSRGAARSFHDSAVIKLKDILDGLHVTESGMDGKNS